MRLVPRQLQRAGMTGNVPYYGGRLSPGQAYAASHAGQAAPPGVPQYSGRMNPPQTMAVAHPPAERGTLGSPGAAPTDAGGAPGPAAPGAVGPAQPTDDLAAVRRLAAAGVITAAELAAIEARIGA